ncbi:trihelix transcription factor ASIL2-like isoform X1 [Cynara cardunculus var. scolymus]|uniref:Myb/SANT-like DNA-binding domain-containing protein n=1 Tax=Cynara cardunculus var. scolymus TaxID=59895 RepID=A0A118JSV7_CYNCS|nr:trihelix transcription factor ASIL2-like isoform X1 [Cynara cardunculus var. scolymus]KVH88809.1 hypothetical protein Ccrd_025411 [Cynara cardunculus var. scolymus]
MSCQSDYNPPSNSHPPHAPPLKPHLSPSSAVSPPTATTHRSSDGNSTTSHQSETAATASMDDNGVAPPLELRRPPPPPPPHPPRNTSFPVREDCWSEEATFTLIEAWGDRYVELNRGNLRQKHWQEVADSVNARHGHTKKARRTDIQCKNRIDTLKKKYKVEKSKVLELGADNYVSPWPFFAPLDSLIGSSFKPSTQTPTPPPQRKRISTPPSLPALPPPPSSVPVGPRSKRPAPPAYQPSTDSSFFRRNFSVMAAAAAAIDGAEDSDTSWSSGGNGPRRLRMQKADNTGGDPYHQLAEAIARFAEVYQRVEEAKQKQMVELEKHRLQFTKDLELQRMKLLMESQLQLVKMKRSKRNPEPDFCRSDDEGDHSASIS